jgi:hypothetical protein
MPDASMLTPHPASNAKLYINITWGRWLALFCTATGEKQELRDQEKQFT